MRILQNLTVLPALCAACLAMPLAAQSGGKGDTTESETANEAELAEPADRADPDAPDAQWWPGLDSLKPVTLRNSDPYSRYAAFRSFAAKASGLQVLLYPARDRLGQDWTVRFEIVVAGKEEIAPLGLEGNACPDLVSAIAEFADVFGLKPIGDMGPCTVERPGGAAPLLLIKGSFPAQ